MAGQGEAIPQGNSRTLQVMVATGAAAELKALLDQLGAG